MNIVKSLTTAAFPQYMVILFIVFLFQFGVSCSCLAMNQGQQVILMNFKALLLLLLHRCLSVIPGICLVTPKQEKLLNSSWGIMNNDTRISLEKRLDCCGLFNDTQSQGVFVSDLNLCDAVRIHPHVPFLIYFGFLAHY